MQFLVVLRGAPASGKTTIARALRNFEKKIVWIKVDNFKDFFADDSSLALQFVNGSAIATLAYLLDNDFSVVMDGVFQDITSINEAVALASKKNARSLIYEMSVSLKTLQERDRTREGVKEGFRKPMGEEILAQIYQKLEENPFPDAIQLDTEKLTLEQCIEKINSDINNETSST